MFLLRKAPSEKNGEGLVVEEVVVMRDTRGRFIATREARTTQDGRESMDPTLDDDDNGMFGDHDVYIDQDADEFASAGFARP